MNQTFDGTANLKMTDAVIQVLVFTFLLVSICYQTLFLYGILAMAGIQCLSTLLWTLFFIGGRPQTKSGRYIRGAFIITMTLLLICYLLQYGPLVLAVLYIMIIVGPVLGFSYFIITLREFSFYRKARKPYYLL